MRCTIPNSYGGPKPNIKKSMKPWMDSPRLCTSLPVCLVLWTRAQERPSADVAVDAGPTGAEVAGGLAVAAADGALGRAPALLWVATKNCPEPDQRAPTHCSTHSRRR